MKFLQDFDVKDKKVILRAGFDMPLDEHGLITDDDRIEKTLPTINYILEQGAKQLIIITTMGRPKGKIVDKLKNNVVAEKLSSLLEKKVTKMDGYDVDMPNDRIVMLENLRFYAGERANDDAFSKKLASYADVYVDDAFSMMHRDHASITGITKYIPGCAGFLVEKELKALDITHAEHPIVAVLGGKKISTRFNLIQALLKKVDKLLLGGAMIFTFYKAKGYEIGKSLYEEDQIEAAKLLMHNEKIVLPTDVFGATQLDAAGVDHYDIANMPKDSYGLDIGPDSVDDFELALSEAKTVVWNGPLGYIENPIFAQATNHIAKYLAFSGKQVIVGGGDTAAAVDNLDLTSKYKHVSTGGGASIAVLAGATLPGVKALDENEVEYFDIKK